MMHKNNSEVYK